MATLNQLQAVFDKIVEAQMPPADSLPPGTSSIDWIMQQKIVQARVETATGKVTGFAPDGLLAVADLAKSMRAGNPAYARGTRLRSLIKQLVDEVVNLKKARAGGPIHRRISPPLTPAWRHGSPP